MRRLLAGLIVGVFILAACGGDGETTAGVIETPAETPSPEPSPTPDACAPENLPLHQEGVLTVGTDSPAFPPWFEDNDPTNGRGFESAVAYEVATRLGFEPEQVEWVVIPFNKSYAPGPKDFDFDINQISITEERKEAVDFSVGYYDVAQAVIALDDSPIADATSLADLKDAKLGAQVGTTSLAVIQENLQPTQEPFVYDTTSDAKSALEAGQIDGIVVDLPTAFFITAVEIEEASVIGQFPGGDEQFGLLFEKGNPLVECVDRVLEEMKADGSLAAIEEQWLSENVDVPVLT